MDRRLIILTLALLVIALAFLVNKQMTTGFFLDKGVELRGGNLITVTFEDASFSQVAQIADNLRKENVVAYPVTTAIGTQLSIEAAEADLDPLIETVNNTATIRDYDVSRIDPKISASVITEIIKGLVFAFLAMAAIIFLLFRNPIPSIAVVLAAFSDLVITCFIMNLAGIQMNMATFTALLMLLGYSVDTDILLTTRTLKERGNFSQNYKSALKTGLTMTAVSTVALSTVIFVAGASSIFGQLAIVIIIGLLVDIPNTWIQNAVILDWYKDRFHR
ncbi:MAG: protein translocase subunit SecF [Candidatus Aenigmarchaeota archaeon]|nr:protein translocase subunit SecF [Candidatus Aenigmarchaeota archaeon]